MKRYFLLILILVSTVAYGVRKLSDDDVRLGEGTVATDVDLSINLTGNPKIRYDASAAEWTYSNDGSNFYDFVNSVDMALKANLASPTFTGVPLAPTAVDGTNTTQLATTAFANASVTVHTSDATDAHDGTAITNTPSGNLAATTSQAALNELQTDIDTRAVDANVLHTTGDESASGVKTLTGQLVTSSTTRGSKPCPGMTEAQRDAIGTPLERECVYNTDTDALNIYTGSAWVEVGSGSGGGISDWVTATSYTSGDVVIQSLKIYQCATTHTSGTFATDLAAVKWVQIAHNVTDAAGVLPIANGGTNSSTALSGSSIAISNGTSIIQGAAGTTTTLLHGNAAGAPTYSSASLTADVTGILPMANGGTAKGLVAVAGGVPYSDADSLEMTGAGTTGQFLKSVGTGAPIFDDPFISGKAQADSEVSVKELQVLNNQLTQTSAAGKYLAETGNKNLLANPDFEHTTATTSWDVDDGTEDGVSESSVVISGLKSLYFNPSAETINLTQSSNTNQAQLADGVQGLAMCRIKSAVAVSMCAIQAGTVSTTNCVTTNTDSKWGLYKVPFILGATSNGVSISSTGANVTGAIYVDDCFVGAVDIVQDNPIIGPWISFTPTGTWVSNTTYTGRYRQVGENAEIQYHVATTGAPTTATLQVNMPTGLVIDTTKIPGGSAKASVAAECFTLDTSVPQYYMCGAWADSTTVIELRTVRADGTHGTFAASLTQAAPMTFASGDHVAAKVSVPIVGYAGKASTYSSQCGANCVDTFRAEFSDAGVTSKENVEWINGNGVVSDTSLTTITFATGLFTVAPNCHATSNYTGAATIMPNITSVSTTTLVMRQYRTSDFVKSNQITTISCQKQGADFVATRTIQGSFNNMVSTPNVTKPVRYSAYVAGASESTVCSTGSCTITRDPSSFVSSVAYSSTGRYTLTTANGKFKASSPIRCWAMKGIESAGFIFGTQMTTTITDANGAAVSSAGEVRTHGATGTAANTAFWINCEGELP